MKTTLLFLSLAMLGLAAPAQARLKVIATVPDLAALAQAVGGKRAEVNALLLPTQDPHFADARPHLALQLNRAQLLCVVGLDLEVAWLPVLQTGARNAAIQRGAGGYLDASTVAVLKEVPRSRIDRSMGDIHPGGNPHYLVDPQNGARVARAIAARLKQLDPEGSKEYQQNLERFLTELSAAEKRWRAALAPYRGTPVVAYHKSWVYFTDFAGLRVVEHLEPKPGIPPSSAHVLHVIQAIRAQRARLLLQEEYYPDRTASLVAQKTGVRLLVLRGGADLRKGEGYLARVDALVRAVASALGAR